MAKERSEKYKQSLHTMIKRIMDARSDSEEWSDESLDGNIQVVSSDDSLDLQGEASTAEEGAEGDGLAFPTSSTFALGGGHASGDSEAAGAAAQEGSDGPIVYCAAEQLRKMKIREAKLGISNTGEIINPLSKIKKKRSVKKCPNSGE